MNTSARMVSLIFAIGIVCLASGIFLWQYGAHGLWLPPCAAFGSLIGMLVSQALFRKAIMGVASIIGGGVIGGGMGGLAVSPCIHSDIPSPYVVFVGAVIGAAIWVLRLCIPVFNKECELQKPEYQHTTDLRDNSSEYLSISFGSLVIGPILGLIFFLIYYVGVGIEPVDRSYLFGYHFNGIVGALLCHVIIGAIGGLLFGVPYLTAWLIKTNTEKMPE